MLPSPMPVKHRADRGAGKTDRSAPKVEVNPVTHDEWKQIASIRRRAPVDARVPVGIGDDTAMIRGDAAGMLVTVDMLLEDVHFDLSTCSAMDVGRKAMNVNLSDIAAMAGRPTAAVVAVAMPDGRSEDLGDRLFHGLQQAADEYGVAMIGGDTNRSPGGLVVSVTLLGQPTGAGPVLRSGAKPGDALCVTGWLGYSLEGHHLYFDPRVAEAQRLHAEYGLHAMIDLSDGIGSDLFHLTGESGFGAVLEADRIPIRTSVRSDRDDKRTPLEHALDDGEDFELLFTLASDDAERLVREQPFGFEAPITRIGRIVEERSVSIIESGVERPMRRGGFAHRWND